MKVLFVSSGNKIGKISPIVKNQGDSLIKSGVEIDFYLIKGKGTIGYFKNIFKLRSFINKNNYELIHAHYSLTAFVVALTFTKLPIVVSLMGSDSKVGFLGKSLIRLFYALFWDLTIVKSEEMKRTLKLKLAKVIPNGVDLDSVKIIEKTIIKKKLGLQDDKINILFLANPNRYEKNHILATTAINLLAMSQVTLHTQFNLSYDKVIQYLNAGDILLLTSLWEGSPNIIKEAMACSLPCVATNVGDIEWLFGDTDGYFLTNHTAEDVAEKLKLAINFVYANGKTKGRDRIIELGLDASNIAKKIVELYESLSFPKKI